MTWQPRAAGDYSFSVRVTDGRGGVDVQNFTIHVTVEPENAVPTIVTSALPAATKDRLYSFTIVGADTDSDQLGYSLLEDHPAVMAIDPDTGVLTWTPGAADVADSPVQFTVRVTDSRGGIAEKLFGLTVQATGPNHAPQFDSQPIRAAVAGQLYKYDASASDDDPDQLVFDLPIRPTGMAIDPNTGAIAWKIGRAHV